MNFTLEHENNLYEIECDVTLSRELYGADYDGNRGAMLDMYELENCYISNSADGETANELFELLEDPINDYISSNID